MPLKTKVTYTGLYGRKVKAVVIGSSADTRRVTLKVTSLTDRIYPRGFLIDTTTTWVVAR